jgi:hypothetical protein
MRFFICLKIFPYFWEFRIKLLAILSAILNIAILSFLVKVSACDYADPKNWDNSEIIDFLNTSEEIDRIPMQDYLKSKGKGIYFSNEVFILELKKGEKTIRAVFKNDNDPDMKQAHGEVSAYEASLLLGWPHVPPTIISEEMKGSLQLFVETSLDLLDPKIHEAILKNPENFEEINRLYLFYFLFGQYDIAQANFLAYPYNKKTYLIPFDNGGMIKDQEVEKYGALPFVKIKDDPAVLESLNAFPFDCAEELRRKEFNQVYGMDLKHGRKIKFIVFNKAIWRQYYAYDDQCLIHYITSLNPEILESLSKITQESLEKIFMPLRKFEPTFIHKVLLRKQMVLDHVNKS